MKYVIIGNSAAAIGAVEGIRQVDKKGEITIISNESHHTYSRPLISYLLLGKTDEQRMKYRPDDFYEKNNCKTLFSKTVTNIDSKKKTVTLDDNTSISYDKLLVSTGSSPFVPPMDGLDSVKNKFSFMTLDEAKALDSALTSDSKVLIVGAGLIGLKCAEGIHAKVANITVIDLAPNILSSILDTQGSAIVQKHLESKGVVFKLGDSVQKFTEKTALLKSGGTIDFDVLVLAVGVRPNTQLVKDAGGEVNRGIVINERMETSIPDIYSAGDCTEGMDISIGQNRILALLPNAYMQGECAGKNMAGEACVFDKAIPMNAIGFFGLHIITAGTYDGEVYEDLHDGYKKLFYKDDLLKGYILIENIKKAGIYTSLIREKTPLSTIDFTLICENPGLMAFGREVREEKLGGLKR
ncbi:MAG: FAD-dependent oxidoreductase [Bacillota bacterium]|nr:FAD-dependent oxidoreductase [Bacillota bacterium]